ncbi:hypothetical protein [Pseudolactococcus paracarnosus]|uniref:Uncharacterized protein n=1 Tax=Pseudolactococcus paracarnosus TaxID=2749962 RepID=A0ABT0AP20_9LACT|nr:hypothetical protein [Lactococcus paracarnosus]MCJ1978314.1 hypothetical protein [Lactococcus paracarnosus]MCJ1984469.1 hypothetical protein [Lactococcus paracarnosus]MCJ1999172.1 hypothetical protein [Lactococcus paracarnosus]
MSLKIPDFSKYQVYREKVGEGMLNPSALFNNFISNIFVGIPLEFLRILVGVATVLSQLLDISSSLGGVQKSIMTASQNVFLALIGGTNGTITTTSVAGFLVILSIIYLLYQWFNGKGRFISSLFHLLAVVVTMFFFFGTFTYTNTKNEQQTAMGGQIAFDTVTTISKKAQDGITSSLTGYSSPNESSSFFEDFVLKPASNLANFGNVDGKLADGKDYFDYDKANGKKGQSYVDGVAKNSNGYLQNDGGRFGEEIMGVFIETMNLFIYVLPVLLVDLLISIFGLVLCLLIMLWPISALMSFIPMFRNAFFHVIKVSMGVLVAPTLLTVFLSFIFYLITRIDYAVLSTATGSKVTDLVGSLSLIDGPLLMAVLLTIFILKIGLMIAIWKNKGKIISLVTGGSSAGQELMNHTDNLVNHISQGVQTFKDRVVGGAELALGVSTGNPAIAVEGAQMLAPKTQSQSDSVMEDTPEQTKTMNAPFEDTKPTSSDKGQQEANTTPDLEGAFLDENIQFGRHESLSDLSETLNTTTYTDEDLLFPETHRQTADKLAEHEGLSQIEKDSRVCVVESPVSEKDVADNSEEFISSRGKIENVPYSVPEQLTQTQNEPFENIKETARNWQDASGILAEARA